MNTSELKLNIIRQVDTLEESALEEIFNFIQAKVNDKQFSALDSLTEGQKNGLKAAQTSIKNGKGIPHDEIVAKYRLRYGIK